ncbi:hypothetical protein Tco_0688695 [Tanacetum coccineum]
MESVSTRLTIPEKCEAGCGVQNSSCGSFGSSVGLGVCQPVVLSRLVDLCRLLCSRLILVILRSGGLGESNHMKAILVRESREMEDELVLFDGEWMRIPNVANRVLHRFPCLHIFDIILLLHQDLPCLQTTLILLLYVRIFDSYGHQMGFPLENVAKLLDVDPYEEVAQQGQAHPLSPAYVPDPMELDEHVPLYAPEPEHPVHNVHLMMTSSRGSSYMMKLPSPTTASKGRHYKHDIRAYFVLCIIYPIMRLATWYYIPYHTLCLL